MSDINVYNVLQKIYGARGIPFPIPPKQGNGTVIEKEGQYSAPLIEDVSETGSLIRKYDDQLLGSYQFLPASIDWFNKAGVKITTELPNPLIIVSGEKRIEETDIVDVGTVFEKVFTRPYQVTIICTIIGENGNWPQRQLRELKDCYHDSTVVTLRSALTDIFLEPIIGNFIIQRIDLLDNQGSENVEVIQINGSSNIQFELEIG